MAFLFCREKLYNSFSGRKINIQLQNFDSLRCRPHLSDIITKIRTTDYHNRFFSLVG